MLSCTIVIKFSQGDYEVTVWKDLPLFNKYCQGLLLTIFGYLIMFLVFFIDVIRKLVLPFALLAGQKSYCDVERAFRNLQKSMSGLTLY